MSQSLYTSITGLTTSQSRLDVIADNIANMNTTAFKASNMTFQTLYARTLSSGSGGSDAIGGTNPMQKGLGVSISSISKDYTNGTTQQTGLSTDLNIQGNGWFTVETSSGEVGFTRDGNFSLDKNGHFVTSSGLKLLGTDNAYSTSSAKENIYVPEYLNLSIIGKDLTAGTAGNLDQLNNAKISTGTFTFDVLDGTGTSISKLTVDLTGATSLQQIATKINTAIAADTNLTDSGNSTVSAVVNNDGTFSFTTKTVSGLTAVGSLGFGDKADTSNFLKETGLATAPKGTDGSYKSNILSQEVVISEASNNDDTYSKASFSVSSTGALEVTYSNGDTLTTEAEDGKIVLKYVTASGKTIKSKDISVNGDVVKPANLQLQLASIQNQQGMLLTGGNIYSTGPNCGDITFSMGNTNGFGEIASGGLESSNVNLSVEFANMILSQRAIDANSRVFSATSEVLQALVRMT